MSKGQDDSSDKSKGGIAQVVAESEMRNESSV